MTISDPKRLTARVGTGADAVGIEQALTLFPFVFLAAIAPLVTIYLSCIWVAIRTKQLSQRRFSRETVAVAALCIAVFSMGVTQRGLWSDTGHYLRFFDEIGPVSELPTQALALLNSVDLGFSVFALLLKVIFQKPETVLLSLAFLSSLVLAIAFRRLLPRTWLFGLIWLFSSVTFYYLVGNALRQGLAAGLGCLSLSELTRCRTWRAYFFAFVAGTVHVTGFLFLPLTWVFGGNRPGHIRSKRLLLSLGILLLLYAVLWHGIAANHSLLRQGDTFLMQKVRGYLSRNDSASLWTMSTVRSVCLLFILITASLTKSGLRLSHKARIVLGGYLFFWFLELAFLPSAVFSNRLASYKMILEPVVLYTIISLFDEAPAFLVVSIFVAAGLLSYGLAGPVDAFFDGRGVGAFASSMFSLISGTTAVQ